jgi:glycosyltransferase involved in cell wall biosynthesis
MKISVITPVFKSEKYLERCIYSLLNQIFQEVEFIFVNDASPDNSMKILKSMADRENRYLQCLIQLHISLKM